MWPSSVASEFSISAASCCATSAPLILVSTVMAWSRRPTFISQRGLSTAGKIINPNRIAGTTPAKNIQRQPDGDVPRFIAHALNQHVDEDGGENSDHDAKLVESHAAAAHSRGSNLRNVVRRNHRGGADAHSANQPPQNELMKIRREEHSHGGKRETQRAKCQGLFSCRDNRRPFPPPRNRRCIRPARSPRPSRFPPRPDETAWLRNPIAPLITMLS